MIIKNIEDAWQKFRSRTDNLWDTRLLQDIEALPSLTEDITGEYQSINIDVCS